MTRCPMLLVLLAIAGCAPRAPVTAPAPADIPALEAELANRPDDAALLVQLGLAHEAQSRPDLALASYQRALTHSLSKQQRNAVEARLVVLTRQQLAADARRAITEERNLTARVPAPNTVAVLPWTYLGADSSLKPLERGMAHLVLTDLARITRLTLLERERVQALSDELALAATGRVDSSSAARSGRLLGAADVVQGALRETPNGELRLDANVVHASDAVIRASGAASDRLPRLFAMEKAVVFELLQRWGVVLTPAERRAIAEQPTADLQAFLAFSRGLEAEDRGDFVAAERQYQDAISRDPGFRAARTRAQGSAGAAAAGRVTGPTLVKVMTVRSTSMRGAQLSAALQNIAPTLAGRLKRQGVKIPGLRSRLAEALRQDDATRLAAITGISVTLPRP